MTDNDKTAGGQGAQQAPAGQFSIQRIYVKDLSFETPNSPDVFRVEWRPDVDIQINSEGKHLDQDVYEVVLRITATVKVGGKTAFLAEVNQAGIFSIQGLPEQHLAPMLGSFCPSILFPYARETISDLVTRGGFPQFLLAPVNFDALYAKHVQEQQAARGAKAAEQSH